MPEVKDFTSEKATWCPGCGDFGVLRALQLAMINLGLEPHNVVLVSGIGCSGKITSYFRSYGFHSMHGRTLPVATGIKIAPPDLTLLVAGGDGDGYGIGLNHLIHAIRRNVNLTYVVMDNGVYGNTKGQTAPNSERGYISSSSPYGAVEDPIQILPLAAGAGIGFLAQGISSDVAQLTDLIVRGIHYEGFALINVISPCVTYDKVHTYEWYKANTYRYDEEVKESLPWQASCEGSPLGILVNRNREDYSRRVRAFSGDFVLPVHQADIEHAYRGLLERYQE
ncbi:thiamine pyrophosphate-dependent enzyme [Alicyclobacillus cycloheptanicus]|uniref:thiamine pyrophosphate-dependent enzyme n=1 Tax=Alicyclobacillus cycloheptanicus TaxID=1457 RepID=UPI0027D8C0B9|nr:thiamine pyrophosphate-dependent enzyme [Alicyclobacillus cycloheptanicus]